MRANYTRACPVFLTDVIVVVLGQRFDERIMKIFLQSCEIVRVYRFAVSLLVGKHDHGVNEEFPARQI